MHGYEHGIARGWPGMILMWLIPILLIALVVRLFVGRKGNAPSTSARQILDERYAEGKIDRDEYLMRLDDLKY